MKPSTITSSFLLALVAVSGRAQFMEGTSAEGVSSLIGGKTVSFNLTKTSLRFDYAGKFEKRSAEERNGTRGYTNWGTSLVGGNAENIAQLVKNGTFVPSASASAFIFRGWTIGREKAAGILQPLKAIGDELNVLDEKFVKDTLQKETGRLVRSLTGATNVKVKDAVDRQKDNIGVLIADLNDIVKESTTTETEKIKIRDSINNLRNMLVKHQQYEKYLSLNERRKSVTEEYDNFRRLNPYKRVLIYGRLGVSATSFKFYESLNTTNFSQSFRDTVFTGPFGEAGVNLFTKSYLIFGLAAGFIRTNTLQGNTPSTLTIEKVSTDASGQTITSKRNVTAYQGVYRQYEQGYVKGDIIVLMAASQKGTFAINPFFRYAFGAKEVIANQLTTGINGYFFNHQGKFLGGLYAQRIYSIDVTSRNQNGTTFTVNRQGIEFGLRASYLFSTVFDVAKPNP